MHKNILAILMLIMVLSVCASSSLSAQTNLNERTLKPLRIEFRLGLHEYPKSKIIGGRVILSIVPDIELDARDSAGNGLDYLIE